MPPRGEENRIDLILLFSVLLLGEAEYDLDWSSGDTDGFMFGPMAAGVEVEIEVHLGVEGLDKAIGVFDRSGAGEIVDTSVFAARGVRFELSKFRSKFTSFFFFFFSGIE